MCQEKVLGLLIISFLLLGTDCIPTKKSRYEFCKIEEGIIAGQMDDRVMEEASGLAYSKKQDNILWTQNDHGDDPRVIAISNEGQRNSIVTLEGVENDDWEDIATTLIDGSSYIFVADTGNNDFDKDPLRIFKFKEPEVDGNDMTISSDEIEKLEVRYEGDSYDCEALTVDQQTGDIFLFTKDRKHSISEVYRYPWPQSESQNPFTLEHIGTLPLFWITGGDISPDGNILALTNKQEAFSFTKPANITWATFLANNPEPCVLNLNDEVQRESIAVTEYGYWTTSECKDDDQPCPLWFYPFASE